jgi:GT2 family glycosyltransferase
MSVQNPPTSFGLPRLDDAVTATRAAPALGGTRPRAAGKFLYAGDEKLYVRGVTYGTFRPDEHGRELGDLRLVAADFAQMAAAGVNAVRTYTVPPAGLLDVAAEHGLRVMVGLPWEQHVAFLDDPVLTRSIEDRVRADVRACGGHPAVLCYAIGNEIPAPIVRWHGRRKVERFLERLCDAVKDEDPDGIVTYVNYPSTEYLHLPFLDVVSFNVYLESQPRLDAYLARLQNVAGDRPLLMAELGLDSRRNGRAEQAETLGWQIRSAFAAGCAGTFVYAWTDEWHRGGFEIEDWDFGLTDRDRKPKPALQAVSAAFAEVPFRPRAGAPVVSVVVCSHNGARTIRECCEGLAALSYPSYEVIVVDDGSTDETAAIAASFGFRVISTPNHGLSNARNTGLAAAVGELVAYIDDDATPDPQWLDYLVHTFETTSHAAAGGPNVPPLDSPIADAVAHAPGGPIHVLLTDTVAEHVPGCNMAFRREALEAVGGFDPQFRTAGDDVDVCWKIQAAGWTIGFSPAALVWHHRRASVRGYLRQQVGYGKAEALLERKWPEKYNAAGHAMWAGRLYGTGAPGRFGRRWRVYYGVWGSGLFQRLYQPPPGTVGSLPLMPEWLLVVLGLAGLSLVGLAWTPLLLVAVPLFAIAAAFIPVNAMIAAARADFAAHPRRERLKRRALTALLNVLQPAARLRGRIDHGLTPWRRRGRGAIALPFPRTLTVWTEHWLGAEDRLSIAEEGLRAAGVGLETGGEFDRWDLEARGGFFGCARLRLAVEEHGGGRQLARFRVWPRVAPLGLLLILPFATASLVAGLAADPIAATVLGGVAALMILRLAEGACEATGSLRRAVARQEALAAHELAHELEQRGREAQVPVRQRS